MNLISNKEKTMIPKKKYTKDREYLSQYIPKKHKDIQKVKKIAYKGKVLKTDYLVNYMHDMIYKYLISKNSSAVGDVKITLWSEILKKKYGKDYKFYTDWLLEHDFMKLSKNYGVGKHSRIYTLNTESYIDIKRTKIYDNFLLKKNSREYIIDNFLTYTKSPIPLEIRQMIVDDLQKVEVDTDGALTYINKLKEKREIDYSKYHRNLISIDNLRQKHIYFKFDDYGRVHTNFTVLKREIRKNFIKIDGECVCELDISNSQPLFLIKLMKDELPTSKIIEKDISRYIDLVNKGLLYEELVNKCGLESRDDAKMMMYKVLFGWNGETTKENKNFEKVFPSVYSFIKEYKFLNDDYKSLSHILQKKESDFIFNKLIKTVKDRYPYISLITIHDSIIFPCKYKQKVQPIFDNFLRNL